MTGAPDRPRVRRGTSNTNARGGAPARRARKLWLLQTYGWDGVLTICWRCGVPLLYEDMEVDRVVPGCQGGRYTRDNTRPCCGPCNREHGNAVRDGIII